jgi:outer membrane protein
MRLPRLFWLTLSAAVVAGVAKAAGEAPALDLLGAVKSAVENNPQLRSQNMQVDISRGQLQQAGGQFDATLSGTASSGKVLQETPVAGGSLFETDTKQNSYNVGVSQQLRNGIVISPQVTMTQTQDNYQYPVPTGLGTATLSISVPLLRGRGTIATDGTELAARENLEANRLIYAHTAALTVQGTVAGYWAYVAAYHTLDILAASEKRASHMLDETGALIQAQMVPAAEIDEIKANLAQHTANRVLAEATLESARQALGVAMGIPFQQIEAIPAPSEDFPSVSPQIEADALDRLDLYCAMALKSRGDLLAAQYSERAYDILYRSALANERPRADLGLQVGYTGLDVANNPGGLFGPLSRNIAGPTYGAQIGFDWPFANNAARGLTLQQKAQLKQASIQASDLARTIQSSVALAIAQLRAAREALRQAQSADSLYRVSLRNEREKFQLGQNTVIDLLAFEDRLDNASTSLIGAQQLYSNAVVALRFQTGTLVDVSGPNFEVPAGNLRTLPEPAAAP